MELIFKLDIYEKEHDLIVKRLLVDLDPFKVQAFTFSQLVTFFTLTEYSKEVSILEKFIQKEEIMTETKSV